MHPDTYVGSLLLALLSQVAETRAESADRVTDGVGEWGTHDFTGDQAARTVSALVEAIRQVLNLDPAGWGPGSREHLDALRAMLG